MSMWTNSCQLFQEVRRQVKDLDDDKFKVMLMWDPATSEDVGWMIVRKDVQVDLSKFQLRDLNLKTLVHDEQVPPVPSSSQISKKGHQNDKMEEVATTSTNVNDSNQERNSPSDMNKNNVDEAHKQLSSSHTNDQACTQSNSQEQPKAYWQKLMRRPCPECNLQVPHGSFLKHLRKAHKIELEKTRAACEICGKSVRKFNLEFHKLVSHGRDLNLKPVEPVLCGKVDKVEVAVASSSIICDSHYDDRIFLKDSNENMMDLMTDKIFVNKQLSSSHSSDHQALSELSRAKWNRSIQRLCPECRGQVSHGSLLKHLKKAHRIEPEKTRVRCDECAHNVRKFNIEFHKLVNHGNKEEGSKLKKGDNVCEVETKFNLDSKIADFKIIYQGRHFNCSRSSTSSIRGALRRFCKLVGQDLVFKYKEEVVTGEERTDSFLGGVIFASGN